jgi:hypothetical protein
MQAPTMNTPVSKCLELATYSIRMLGKFSTNAVLTALASEMAIVKDKLANTQQVYEAAVFDILPSRVDVKYENYASDRRIRLTQQKSEIVDGKKGGRIAKLVFPDGSAPITRLLGESQIQRMIDLEGLLASVEDFWSDAASEKADIAQHRIRYKAAIDLRTAAGQTSRAKRALRNAAKEAFITKYVEIISRVEAEFPRDKQMQDLFFDDVRTKSALVQADEDNETESPDDATTAEDGHPG